MKEKQKQSPGSPAPIRLDDLMPREAENVRGGSAKSKVLFGLLPMLNRDRGGSPSSATER